MRLAIDGCRVRSGGAVAHLVGILAESSPRDHGIEDVHLFAPPTVQARIPDRAWLIKHTPGELTRSLPFQLMWQAKQLSKNLNRLGCNLLFTADASTLCGWGPSVVLSQDMLSYEPNMMQYFGFAKQRARLEAIKIIQNRAFRRAAGVIFLTRYASGVIQNSCGPLHNVAIIPHGIDQSFRAVTYSDRLDERAACKVRCTYVSNAALYKNQWVVVEAIAKLREEGVDATLTLIGGGEGPGMERTRAAVRNTAGEGEFVTMLDHVSRDVILHHLAETDIFVFASSCEAISVTLLEGMAAGLPIACSEKGPLPEVLGQNGVYFDPTRAESIAAAIGKLIDDRTLRVSSAASAKRATEAYTWARCGDQTWAFLAHTWKLAKGAVRQNGALR